MEQGSVGRLAVVGLGGALARTVDDDDHVVAAGPARTVDDLLDDGREVGGLVLLVQGVPGRHVAPGHRGAGLGPVGDVEAGGGEGRGVVDVLGVEVEGGGDRVGLVGLELEVGVGDGGALGHRNVEEAHPHLLLAHVVRVVDELQVGAVQVHGPAGALLGVVVGGGDANIDGAAVTAGEGAVVVVGCGIGGGAVEVVDALEAGVPNTGGRLLAGHGGVAVLQEERGVGRARQAGHLDPGHQVPGGAVVELDLVAQLGRVGQGEAQVVTVGLDRTAVVGVLQVGVGDGDQDREVGEGGVDLGAVDGEGLAVLPVRAAQAGGSDPGREGQGVGEVQT